MSVIEIFNSIIVRINQMACSIRNTQAYIGTEDETNTETLTGRVAALEDFIDEDGKIKCEKLDLSCHDEWPDEQIEWD